MKSKVELLLPVADMNMCLAAIHHGADAIYVGVPYFNARGRTHDLTIEELKEMIDICHLYGVKVNLAFNVVIFEDEFPKVIDLLNDILPLGPDAFIVQDLGLAKLIRSMSSDVRIHASTQMTVTNADAMEFLSDLRIDRFVLGRENSITEIKKIREQTQKELEVFVHGALCVAYSGQCFTSESIGGRSANRGQCAQSCRLEYELYVDDKKKELGDKKYLVSPKDLMGIAHVSELKELGVNSFKVEGRLKTPEYVASSAKNYREVLDGSPLNLAQREVELSSTYSRGFFTGWLNGVDHQKLVDGTYSAHRGMEIGVVKEVRKKKILLSSSIHLMSGMGLLFVGSEEKGSKIFEVSKKGNIFEVELLSKLEIKAGERVYLNSNEVYYRELQKGWSSREKQKRIGLKILVQGEIGEPLLVKAIDPEGREVYVQTSSFLSSAMTKAINEKFIKDEISSLSSSVYEISSFECYLQENLYMNHREIKELRKDMVQKMNEERLKREYKVLPFNFESSEKSQKVNSKLNILLRTKDQVEGFLESYQLGLFTELESYIGLIILDFEFGKDYAKSVDMIKSEGFKVAIATTRILKPLEYYNLNTLIRINPDYILVRNLGAFEYLKKNSKISLIGDFSLNVTNSLSFNYLVEKDFDSINVSYDLNESQLIKLVHNIDPAKLEVTIHQYMPEFHMEHCVFAGFLSKGHSFKDCGKPCEKHEVKLKDPYGNWHFLKADHECRNTFYKATPQSASHLISKMSSLGVGHLRLEALNENKHDLNLKIKTYLELLAEKISTKEAIAALGILEGYGLSSGQLFKKDDYKDRKKN